MNRRGFLQSVAAQVALPAARASRPVRPPNVLFVLADEWRAQATRYNGDPNVRTPVLDRLAAQSVSFDCAISGNPVCCPYRASLMTGQYSLTNGVFINDVELKPKGTTLAQAFTKAGYRTGFIGKWHLYGSPDGKYGRRLSPVPPDKRFGFDYWKAAECSHEYNHSLYFEGNDTTPRYWPGYDALAQTDDACGFIDRQSKSADPFFLTLSLGPPHFPYETAPERYQAMYRDVPIQLRPNVPAAKRDAAIKALRGYYAHMAALDDCLDKLLKKLDEAGIAEDTLVVFTSDHGDMMLSQGLTTKLYPWDESIRVPFLMRYPRRRAKGARFGTPFNSPDIMPTLLKTCGIPIPDGVQGTDYSGLFTGTRLPPRDTAALINLPVPITEARRYGFAEYRGLRTERHTYVRSIHGPWLLYDNHRDPFQMHNLCNKKEDAQLQKKLDTMLDAKLRSVGDEFLPASEYIKRANVGHYREVTMPAGHTVSPWGDWQSTLS
jgi:arylsulfatase A-like enzyme